MSQMPSPSALAVDTVPKSELLIGIPIAQGHPLKYRLTSSDFI
jgi:hypothetical protein